MSISEFSGTKKSVVGMESYRTPSNELLLQRPLQGKIFKSKKHSYIEEVIKEAKKNLTHVYDKNEPFAS